MEDRLDKLELKMMSAEDQLDELNRTVWRQQQEIELLREQVRELARQLKAVRPADPLRPEDEVTAVERQTAGGTFGLEPEPAREDASAAAARAVEAQPAPQETQDASQGRIVGSAGAGHRGLPM